MLRAYRPTDTTITTLANLARTASKGRDVLFYGTGNAHSILRMGILCCSTTGDTKVSFTRSPEVAAYFALLGREDDEGQGAILIFDRHALATTYCIEPYHDPFWDEDGSWTNEMEERIWQDIDDVGEYLIGLVTSPPRPWSRERRSKNMAFRNHIRGWLFGVNS